MNRTRHAFARAERLLAELDAWAFEDTVPLAGWTSSGQTPPNIRDHGIAERLQAASAGIAGHDGLHSASIRIDGAPACHLWLSRKVDPLPEGRLLRVSIGCEALVFLDGIATSGVDANHDEVVMPGGRAVQLDVLLFTGRDEAPVRCSFTIVRPDPVVSGFRMQLKAVLGAARTLPQESTLCDGYVDVLERVLTRVDRSAAGPDLGSAARALDEGLAELRSRTPKSGIDVHLVASSHIDVTWLWTLDETRFKMAKTTATALHHVERFPGWSFAQSQPALYAMLERDAPELFARLAERVSAGWEPLGACWIEPDCNVSNGESLVRQVLYGQQYWQRRFGFRSRILWLPDTFGYSASMPQILRKAGLEAFVTTKMTWNDTNRFPHDHFDWEGIDGSRIRCVFPQYLGGRVLPEDIDRYVARSPSRQVAPALLYSYGWGDGGGGPEPEDILLGRHLADLPGFPSCRYGTMEESVLAMADAADRRALETGRSVPVWSGELYLELHRGTLTTHGRAKSFNRRLEAALREAEWWSALANVRRGMPWPSEELREAWETLLLHQFHDIVTGTSIAPVYDTVYTRYEAALRSAEALSLRALGAMAGPTDPGAFAVCNAHGWRTVAWMETTLQDAHAVALVGEDGEVVPHQVLDLADDGARVGFEVAVPPLSWTGLRTRPGRSASRVTGVTPSASPDRLENAFFDLSLDASGRIVSLYDKRFDREWLSGPANDWQTFDDRPVQWEAWDIDPDFEAKPLALLRCTDRRVVESGPLRATLRISMASAAGSTVALDVHLYRSIPRVDFTAEIDWKEPRVLLKVAFPLAVRSDHAYFEIPFGTVTRPTHRNTSWDEARFEVCGHRWVDLSDATGGVSLLNDGRYGHDVRSSTLRLTLLRNPAHAEARQPTPPFRFADHAQRDVFTDTGRHRIRYSLYPHAGNDRTGTVSEAAVFNAPPRLLGMLPSSPPDAGSGDPAVVLDTLKRAEDGDGFILRVYEALGGARRTTIRLPFPVLSAESVDLVEQPAGEPLERVDSDHLSFPLGAYEIRSFRLRPA